MKQLGWQILLGFGLLILSTVLYFIHYALFRDSHHILIFLVADIAFLPVEVLLVTLIIDRLLRYREKRSLLNKLNMVIGTFFSEAGSFLLKALAQFDLNIGQLQKELCVTPQWSDREFTHVSQETKKHKADINIHKGDLQVLRRFLLEKRGFFVALLGNPNLLEHESFTDVLWAVVHLAEELGFRGDLTQLSPADYEHLAGDMKRAYDHLLREWLSYMKHLRAHYPFLFSLAMRMNPFDPNAAVEIR